VSFERALRRFKKSERRKRKMNAARRKGRRTRPF